MWGEGWDIQGKVDEGGHYMRCIVVGHDAKKANINTIKKRK
jgi:hypothetical protein